ncbi:MAG: YidC/Oxa1 family membrane protein insertase [Acutalibacteraceae bacterium]|nr:YidC/Oxa1 family membrane protein insertase [Acutalibacteraceae bacterium]
MQALFNIINKPLGWVLENLANVFNGNFALAVFFFTLIINLVLIPLSIKSQKSSMQQARIKPKLDELKAKYGDDKQKYSMAMQDLYKEEGVSMSGGCLPMILRLVFMMSIYYLIMQPLTYLMHVDAETINEAVEAFKITAGRGGYELELIESVLANPGKFPELDKVVGNIDFNFLGINLTGKPVFNIDIFHHFNKLWIMPLVAFAAQLFTSFLSLIMQKKTNPEAPSMAGMMLTMPLISLFIGFSVPAGVAFYWACSSLIGGLIQVGLQMFYGPQKMLAKERAKEIAKQCDFETAQIKNAQKKNEN